MKKHLFIVLALSAAGSAMAVPVVANLAFATQKNCMACHAVDKKVVGPSFKDVAAKYDGKSDALEKLSAKVVKGGSGTWGPVPMPANTQVSAEEAKSLVTWILGQK